MSHTPMIIESTKDELPHPPRRCTWVAVADEIVAQMRDGWSDPVRVRIDPPNEHRDYPEMVFRVIPWADGVIR